MTTAILTTIESLELGKLLRGLRSDLELTQTDLVELLFRVRGVSQSWLSNVERGYSLPTAGQLEHLLGTYTPTADQRQRAHDLVASEVLR